MRKVTVYKEILCNHAEDDFPLCKFMMVSNITFMQSDKDWSIITSIEKWHDNVYCIWLVPLSDFWPLRMIQKAYIILTN